MPLYEPEHVEYTISNGHIHIVMEDGSQLPAYWAHPNIGTRLPGVCLLHDWWGINDIIRRIANLLAGVGYYVIVPDMFNGEVATSLAKAKTLVEELGDDGYSRIDAVLNVLENHHQVNGDVAAIGIGLGGSLAFNAALERDDLEAAVALYGFPQRVLGQFDKCNTPILAIYPKESLIPSKVVKRLKHELAQTPLADQHKVVVLEGGRHGFISDHADENERKHGRFLWKMTMEFLEQHLESPTKPAEKVF